MYRPVLEELYVLFTELAQAFQKALFFIVGHLSVHASSQNRQICCTRVEISAEDHSLGPNGWFESGKRLFLDAPSTGARLETGFPGVFPSVTKGLLEAMLPQGIGEKHQDKMGRVGARLFLAVD